LHRSAAGEVDVPAGDQGELEREGYRVTRIKAEGSCYEIKAEDKAGRRVELKLNPVDGGLRKEEVRS
jgi:hypothetical protein